MSAKHAVFDLGRIFSPSPSRYALLLLNQSVLSESRFALLWKGARVRSCVDGGANRHGTLYIIWLSGKFLPSCVAQLLVIFRSSPPSSAHTVKLSSWYDYCHFPSSSLLKVVRDLQEVCRGAARPRFGHGRFRLHNRRRPATLQGDRGEGRPHSGSGQHGLHKGH